jgi:hypothetical protein
MMAIQEQRDYGIALFEKIRFDRASGEKFYGIFREQYNPELSLPDAAIDDLLAVGTFRSKEKEKAPPTMQAVRDWSFAEEGEKVIIGLFKTFKAVPIVQFARSNHANRSNMSLSAAATPSAMRCMPASLGCTLSVTSR